jgi:hypothetical protein
MRILFLSQVLPYLLDAGPKLRGYFVLRHLDRQHQVTLLTFVRETDRPQDIAHLTELCDTVHTVPMVRTRLRDVRFLAQSLLTRQPFIIVLPQVRAEMPEAVLTVIGQNPLVGLNGEGIEITGYVSALKLPIWAVLFIWPGGRERARHELRSNWDILCMCLESDIPPAISARPLKSIPSSPG